jgi:nucleoside-diphosphate-sugar epimerase
MKVLVIGGTGYIGSHTVEELLRRGHDVSVFARGLTSTRLPEPVSSISGDRHRPEDLARARQLDFDAIIDINAYAREETQAVINQFDGHISRFVHLSTVSVCQFTSPLPLNEDDALQTDPAAGYGYNKAECERALRWAHSKSGFPFVSIRPTAVFGPRDRISRENYYLKRIIAGDPCIVPDSGSLPIAAIFVKDLASMLANALTAEGVEGSAYTLSQPELVCLDDHIVNIASLAGEEAILSHIPSRLLERLGFNLYQFPYYTGNRLIVFDTRAAARDLQFSATPYIRALEETVKCFLEREPHSQASFESRWPLVVPRSHERAVVERYRAAQSEMEDRLTDEWLNESMPTEN